MKELLKLCAENPNHEVIWLVDRDVVGGDEHAYWQASIETISLSFYWQGKNSIRTDEDDIKEEIAFEVESEGFDVESETDRRFQEKLGSGEIKKVILVKLGVPRG